MFMGQDYRYNRHSVSLVNYHLIWITRRRRKVLVNKVKDRLDEPLREKATELGIEVIALEINPDHVHLFMNTMPNLAICQVAFRLKGYTSRILRQEFPHLRKMPSMWTRSYFASTAGNVSSETIRKYIEAQGKK
jgi:putative transposase